MEPGVEQQNIAQNLTYDILECIFLRCLPEDPLNHRQPDVSRAPMLLCHICAGWRNAALSTPSIWTSLYYVAVKKPTFDAILDNRDIGFLRWWHDNIGTLQPSLRLSATERHVYKIENLVSKEAGAHACEFMIEFISSAQHLHLDIHYSMALQSLLGDRPISSPALDTLVLWCWRSSDDRLPGPLWAAARQTHFVISVSQNQFICRLFIHSLAIITTAENIKSIMAWSHITHIFMNIQTEYYTWFSLVRECTSLVAGNFDIFLVRLETTVEPPSMVTLPQLRHLCVFATGNIATMSLLHRLHLPSLTALTLRHLILSVDILHRELQSTPALKELHVGPCHFNWTGQESYAFIPGDLEHHNALHHLVPELEFVHFGGRLDYNFAYKRPNIFRTVLAGTWLQLGAPGNRIKQIELSNESCHPSNRDMMEGLVPELQRTMPLGVQLSLRPQEAPAMFEDWYKKCASFTDDFEDMWFYEHL